MSSRRALFRPARSLECTRWRTCSSYRSSAPWSSGRIARLVHFFLRSSTRSSPVVCSPCALSMSTAETGAAWLHRRLKVQEHIHGAVWEFSLPHGESLLKVLFIMRLRNAMVCQFPLLGHPSLSWRMHCSRAPATRSTPDPRVFSSANWACIASICCCEVRNASASFCAVGAVIVQTQSFSGSSLQGVFSPLLVWATQSTMPGIHQLSYPEQMCRLDWKAFIYEQICATAHWFSAGSRTVHGHRDWVEVMVFFLRNRYKSKSKKWWSDWSEGLTDDLSWSIYRYLDKQNF